MSEIIGDMLWLIPGLPLAASILIALFGPRLLRGQSHLPCVLASVASCLLAATAFLVLVLQLQYDPKFSLSFKYYTWFRIGEVYVPFALQADWLTGIMLVTITFIGSLIAIFAIGYMRGD